MRMSDGKCLFAGQRERATPVASAYNASGNTFQPVAKLDSFGLCLMKESTDAAAAVGDPSRLPVLREHHVTHQQEGGEGIGLFHFHYRYLVREIRG